MQKNFTAYLVRTTESIRKNLQTPLRISVLQRACKLLSLFDKYLQMQAIDQWTDEFSLSKKMLLGFLHGEKKSELTPAEELREFLFTFKIRQNEITGEIFISKNKKTYTIEELEYVLDIENYNPRHYKKFINPANKNITVTKLFNPLNDFFTKLADKYKGERLIGELSDCITAHDFGDREEGFYQKRLEYYLRKWLFKAAGQAMYIGQNDAMLLWVEPLGGSGKSYLNRWLFSIPELKNYYLRIGENASYIDMQGIAKGKFAIDWDELPLSKKRYQTFKSYTAAESVDSWDTKKKKYTNFSRQVNFIGSTNNANRERQKGFLLDDDDAMKRRIISIEISGRSNYEKYLKDIDLYQLWGEAASGILQAHKADNKQILTYECDYEDLRIQNSRYVNNDTKTEHNIILSKFRPAKIGKGRVLNPQDMIVELNKQGIKISLSKEAIGRYLSKHGYIKGRIGNYKGWWIKE